MVAESAVYVPRDKLPLRPRDISLLLQCEGVPLSSLYTRGVLQHKEYIDADVVVQSVFHVIRRVPLSSLDVFDYVLDTEDMSAGPVIREYLSAFADLFFLADLYDALAPTGAVIISKTKSPADVLPEDYKYPPSSFVPLSSILTADSN